MILKSRQVNLDPEPYSHPSGARASSVRDVMPRTNWTLDPRSEFEPTRDPEPWEGFHVRSYAWVRLADPSSDRRRFAEVRWAPRREQFDTPVNPILVAFREYVARHGMDLALRACAFGSSVTDLPGVANVTWGQIDHARRVLVRLVSFATTEKES